MASWRSWTLRICFAVRSCRSSILIFHFTVVFCGSWTSRTCFAVRSCRSSILIFHFTVVSCGSWTLRICFAVRSCRSWILIFHFAVVSCGSWIFEDLFCREILQILDLEISVCHRILWILDPIFWPRHKSGHDLSVLVDYARSPQQSGTEKQLTTFVNSLPLSSAEHNSVYLYLYLITPNSRRPMTGEVRNSPSPPHRLTSRCTSTTTSTRRRRPWPSFRSSCTSAASSARSASSCSTTGWDAG